MGVLRRLTVLDEVLALGPPPLTREYNADVLTGICSIDPAEDPGEVGYSLSVRRETLDAILVRRARSEPTVELRERTVLRRLLTEKTRVAGAEIAHEAGSEHVRARVVVGADGYASPVARLVDAPIQEQVSASRAMYYRYAFGVPGPEGDPDGAEFSLADDELAYVFPSDGSTACVALSVNLRRFRQMRRDPGRAFSERLAAHPFLAPRIQAGTWAGRLWGCGPRPAVVRVPWGLRWALVGDASLHQDPWTGLGMDNAAVHAVFLAEALDDVLSGRTTEQSAMATYHRRRDEHALRGFRETCELGRDLNALRAS